MKRRSVRQLALDETRKVVYHSHHARVLNSGWADHAKRSGNIVADLIRRGDYRATFHRRCDVFPAYDHLDFSRTVIAGHAFIQDRHQSRLFFEGPKEFAHCFSAGKLWLSENVGGSINIDLTGGRLFADQAAFAKQHRVAQQAIIKRLLLAHQRDDFGANRQQTLATKLGVQIPSRLIQFILAKILIETDDFVLNDVRRRHEHYQDAFIRQSQELDVLETVLSQRRPHDYSHILRERGKHMRGSFHQTIGPGASRINLADALNRPAVAARKTRVAQNVIDVIAVSLIGGNATGRGMRLLEQSRLFQFAHHIADRRRTPSRRVLKAIGYRVGPDRLARNQMLPDDRRQNGLATRVRMRCRRSGQA